eukprot:XP_025001421.1 gametocyte-specific factor 1 isoform X3 [Gallus gallus]
MGSKCSFPSSVCLGRWCPTTPPSPSPYLRWEQHQRRRPEPSSMAKMAPGCFWAGGTPQSPSPARSFPRSPLPVLPTRAAEQNLTPCSHLTVLPHSFMCALNRANNGVATLAESFAQRVDPAGKAAVAHPASDQRRFPPARAGRVPFAPLSRASAPQPPLLLLLAEPSERRIFLLPGPQPRRA